MFLISPDRLHKEAHGSLELIRCSQNVLVLVFHLPTKFHDCYSSRYIVSGIFFWLQLLRIEEELGSVRYAGEAFRSP